MRELQSGHLVVTQPCTSVTAEKRRQKDQNRGEGRAADGVDNSGCVTEATPLRVTKSYATNFGALSPLTGAFLLCSIGLLVLVASTAVTAAPIADDDTQLTAAVDPALLQMYDSMFERNIRAPRQKFIRFGRAGQKFIRFGRNAWDYNAAEPSDIGNELEAFDYQPAQIRRFISSPKRAQKFIRFG